MKEVTMPKLSDTMTEGAVVVWRKSAGDLIERGEVIAEVETDKATMELEAFASGILLEIRVEAGKTVPVGTVIGVIGERGELPKGRETTPVEPAAEVEPEVEDNAGDGAPEAGALPGTARVSTVGEGIAAPVVRRRARELGIDLATVTGSGPGGRILLDDLKPTVAGAAGAASRKTVAREEPPPENEPDDVLPQGAQGIEPAAAQPLSRMRAAIARTVSDSWRNIPHFSVTIEVRMDSAERFRRRLKEGGTTVSLTAVLVKASALALGDYPRLNASLQDGSVVIHPDINIGIVAQHGEGLLVPVLRDCAKLSFGETASRTAQLVERVRHGQLSDTELTGGTFAISNLGMFGIQSFVALILPPMAAVLAAGAVRDGVVVQDGRPVVARLMTLTLSADHRLVDGVYAAEFMKAVKSAMESPEARFGEVELP